MNLKFKCLKIMLTSTKTLFGQVWSSQPTVLKTDQMCLLAEFFDFSLDQMVSYCSP